MKLIKNVEFYTTPDGEVMVKEVGRPAFQLQQENRQLIGELLAIIRVRYPKAHKRLMEIYSASSMNPPFYEYRVLHRFIRCNFGEYDQNKLDIDHHGRITFEEVRCPLRGECIDECVICKPQLDTQLSDREYEVFRLIADDLLQAEQIAEELHLSPCTVNRHRESIKAKLGVKSVKEMVDYWRVNNLK